MFFFFILFGNSHFLQEVFSSRGKWKCAYIFVNQKKSIDSKKKKNTGKKIVEEHMQELNVIFNGSSQMRFGSLIYPLSR